MSKAPALPGYPDTYQVILLALGRVLGVPLLFPGSLLKIIVAAIVVVARVAASAPAPTSGSKLLWHKEGKGTKDHVRDGEKQRPALWSRTFLALNTTVLQPICRPTASQPIPFCSPRSTAWIEDNMAPGPPGTAGVKVSWKVLRIEALRGFLVSSSAIMMSKITTSGKPG